MKQKLLDDGTLYVEVKHALQVKRVLIEDREHWGTMFYPEEPIDFVRCAECKFWSENTQFCHMFSTRFTAMRMLPNDFCSLGVKKENE